MKPTDKPKFREYTFFSDDMIQKLMKIGRSVKYKKGAYIFRDKYETENIYIILEGKASIYKLNDSGNKRIIFILSKGSLLNEPISISLTSSVNCVAFEESTILVADRTEFLNQMAKDFELTMQVINQLSHRARRMYRQLKNANASTKIEKKVAAKLWKLCLDYGKEYGNKTIIDIDITGSSLADLMGARRETVSRAVKTLQEEGLITYEKRKIIVFCPEKLANYFKSL